MVDKLRMTEEFCRLVAIDSISFREKNMAAELTRVLEELGFDVTMDGAGEYYQSECGNLYARLKGDLKGDPILFSSHMDTVEPGIGKKAILQEDGTITSDGTTVLGADDLSGIVSILEAVRTIREEKIPHRSIEILFTIAEEVYVRGSEVFDFTKIKAREAYVLDLDGPIGRAAYKAPTFISFTAAINGKASHAGFAPEKGIHAIAIAAEAIVRIPQGKVDDETTVNIGMIEGGTATNIVPERCILKGEIRSHSHEKAMAKAREIERIFHDTANHRMGTCDYQPVILSFAYHVAESHPVISRFIKACDELSIAPELIETMGGSDNNKFLQEGITGIVIACGMHQVHSCKEYTHVDDLEKCCQLLVKLMTS